VRLRPPATVVENAPGAMGRSSGFLLFLRAAESALPAGASVVVLGDRGPGTDAASDTLIAVGQLPRQEVLSPARLGGEVPRPQLPRYVVAFGRPLEDPRYRLFRELPGGFLYRAGP
jgi:hypothetical protein